MQLDPTIVDEMYKRFRSNQKAELAQPSREGFELMLKDVNGEPIALPESCGQDMDEFLDKLITKWHAARG